MSENLADKSIEEIRQLYREWEEKTFDDTIESRSDLMESAKSGRQLARFLQFLDYHDAFIDAEDADIETCLKKLRHKAM